MSFEQDISPAYAYAQLGVEAGEYLIHFAKTPHKLQLLSS